LEGVFNKAKVSAGNTDMVERNPRNPLTYYEIHLYTAKTN